MTTHLNPITPLAIKQAFLTERDPELGLHLINHLFFDKRRRQQPHADTYRTQVVQLLPEIFTAYPKSMDQVIRSTLVRKIAHLACLEQAIDPREAIIHVFKNLITKCAAIETLRRQHRLNLELTTLEARIKAELAGKATAGDPAFIALYEAPPAPNHSLTSEDLSLMIKTLKRFSDTPAIDVSLAATTALNEINYLLNQLPNQS